MPATPGVAGMRHATLRLYEPPTEITGSPGGRFKQLEFQYNPQTVSLSKGAHWQQGRSSSTEDAPPPQFLNPDPRKLSMQILLDSTDKPHGNQLRRKVEVLLAACSPTPKSVAANRPSPPWAKIDWGSFTTIGFYGYMESVNVEYSVFSSEGDPLRATCALSITEIPDKTSGQNPTSGALNSRRARQTVAGDSLQSLAFQEYGQANSWRAIADANGIDDPMRLAPGTELLLPAPEEIA